MYRERPRLYTILSTPHNHCDPTLPGSHVGSPLIRQEHSLGSDLGHVPCVIRQPPSSVSDHHHVTADLTILVSATSYPACPLVSRQDEQLHMYRNSRMSFRCLPA